MIPKLVQGFMRHSVVLSLIATTFLLPATGSAQAGATGFSLGLSGGFARANSAGEGLIVGNVLQYEPGGLGYYMQATLEMPSPFRVIRPRADLFFADWGQHVTALTGNLVFTPFSSKKVAPYLIAGAGAYMMPAARIKSGGAFGAGLRLPGEKWSVTIESRVHVFLRSSAWPAGSGRARAVFTPIGLGIQF